MMLITIEQRRALVEHALDCNRDSAGVSRPAAEEGFADVIADLAMGRPVVDRDLFVSFLWQRVSLAVQASISRQDHRVWCAAVMLLDRLGEDLDDIFAGRPSVSMLETRWDGQR